MTLPANLSVYVSAGLFVIGAYAAALYVGLIVWTFRDIRARSRDMLAHILAVLLVALFTLPGLLIYLLLRPHVTLAEEYERSLAEEALLQDLDERRTCPSCHRRVDPDFVVCPSCHHQLRLRCVGCARLLSPSWDVCPYCGLFSEQAEESGEAIDAPVLGAQTEPSSMAPNRQAPTRPEADGAPQLEQGARVSDELDSPRVRRRMRPSADVAESVEASPEAYDDTEVTGNLRDWSEDRGPAESRRRSLRG